MDFFIRKDARKWFGEIKNDLDIDFDAYYFCFVAGIASGHKRKMAASETAQLVDYFPGDYKNRGRLLVALFLRRELDDLGVDLNERAAVRGALSNLVDPASRNFLTDTGVREFNKYAHHGFDVLQEWFGDKPRTLDTFLRIFRLHVQRELDSSDSAPREVTD